MKDFDKTLLSIMGASKQDVANVKRLEKISQSIEANNEIIKLIVRAIHSISNDDDEKKEK